MQNAGYKEKMKRDKRQMLFACTNKFVSFHFQMQFLTKFFLPLSASKLFLTFIVLNAIRKKFREKNKITKNPTLMIMIYSVCIHNFSSLSFYVFIRVFVCLIFVMSDVLDDGKAVSYCYCNVFEYILSHETHVID